LGEFVIRSGGHTWADLDNYMEFSLKSVENWTSNVVPHIETISNVITRVDTTNISWFQNADDVNLLSIITYHLKPGQEQVFNQAVSKIHKAIQENNREGHYAFEWNVNGGPLPTVSLVLPFRNWADMQGPEEPFGVFMARVLGEEGAKQLWSDLNSTYHTMESVIIRVRRDLSVISEQ
jgi:hypothetical protein